MKILFPLNSFFPTTLGGPGTMLYWHSVYLKKFGVEPVIITTTNGIKEELTTNTFLDLPCGSTYYNDRGMLNFSAQMALIKEIRKADIIHLTSVFSPTSLIAFLTTVITRSHAKIVWSVRGELNENALQISKLKKRLLLYFYKLFFHSITFASTSAKETLEIRNYFKNSSVIELPNVMPTPNRLQKTEERKRFLYLGRIHPIKNIESLISAFYKSRAFEDPEIFLDIAGEYDERDNSYFHSLKALVAHHKMESKVNFLGHVAGLEKEKLLANAYFLLLPSHTENFGNVVLEALNQGTPVVASTHTPWQDLNSYQCGLWVENSVSSLAQTFIQAAQLQPQEYKTYKTNAIQFVNEHYNIQKKIQQWILEYQKILN